MRSYIFSLLLASMVVNAKSQPSMESPIQQVLKPRETTILYKLGETIVPISISKYGEDTHLTMINLHADEVTSIEAAKKWLEVNGGVLIRIINKQQRNIKFKLHGKKYQFDPNRMFGTEGLTTNMTQMGRVTPGAVAEVEKFGKRILGLFPANPGFILALHNNTEGNFTIRNYLPGNSREVDAKRVNADAGKDPDDLFLTTDSILYDDLSSDGYNIVWQDNINARKDGSLSIYCGERGIRYVNCETQHGKTNTYFEMLTAACEHIAHADDEAATFSFQLEIDSIALEDITEDIYFGERKVGNINALVMDSISGRIHGKLTLHKNFPLYSNLDFFYITAEKKLEARFDPTREKKMVVNTAMLIPVYIK